MYKIVVTAKGQVVIPSQLRRSFGIKKGTQICMYEIDGAIVMKSITDEYIQKMVGVTGTNGKLLKALMQQKAREREL